MEVGLDLQFPHHEAEIAQCRGAYGTDPARYWMHNNMVTIDGAKMSKSAGNFITLEQLFNGNHPLIEKAFHPMIVRFLMLQSHYRSKIDFTNSALLAAEKGYQRLIDTMKLLEEIEFNGSEGKGEIDNEIAKYCDQCYKSMGDDFNTAQTLAALFEISSRINSLYHGQLHPKQISNGMYERMVETFRQFIIEVLGLKTIQSEDNSKTEQLVEMLIDIRAKARVRKDFETADNIRDDLAEIGILLKDEKSGKTTYKIKN
jgi:cysteinyl-tRNA synthetase